MSASIWIEQVTFKDGTTLQLAKDSIVLFVGPNNSGKSQTLRDLQRFIGDPNNFSPKVINTVQTAITGSEEEVKELMKGRLSNGNYYSFFPTTNGSISEPLFLSNWSQAVLGNVVSRNSLVKYVSSALNTDQRLVLVNAAPNVDFKREFPKHPLQVLYMDSSKENMFSRYFQEAFGEKISVNRAFGNTIPLVVGEPPVQRQGFEFYQPAYQEELRKLPTIDQQGDGMRSFAGVFLNVFAQDYTINIIDEPEAFLHPPQAALLAKMMATSIGTNKQLFLATHSEHFLKGMLENASDRLVVVRVQRMGNINDITVLDNSDLTILWGDSLLRHTNILDGIFHKRVVLVESDSDIRFYSALTAVLVKYHALPSPDILFVQTGGKHRFTTAVRALQKLKVPLTIIGDFDWYHEEKPARAIFETLGGDWNNVKTAFEMVQRNIDQKRPPLVKIDLQNEVTKIFDSINTDAVPEKKVDDIKDLLKQSSPWKQAKSSGSTYLDSGQVSAAFAAVQSAFAAKDLHILEIGEIEAFDKLTPGHGPKWVNGVLEKDLLNATELEVARKFVREKILKLSS